MRAQNGPGKAEAQQAKADQGLAKLGGLIESSVDDQGRVLNASIQGGAATWPFRDGLSIGPQGRLALRRLGDLVLAEATGWPVLRCESRARAAGAIGAPGGTVLLAALAEGEAVFKAWDNRLRPVRHGEVLILDSDCDLDLRGEPGARIIGLLIPVHLLSPRFVARERLKGGALRAHFGGVPALLRDLMLGLSDPKRAAPGAGALIDVLGGLVSATLEDCWASTSDDSADRLSRARLDQISQHMRRHFADPDLSAEDVAKAVGISRRYLHKLFTEAGRSFRAELVNLRIEACLRVFADEKQAGKTIADVAFAAGYTDISQFNRHFRRIHGETPSAARRALAARAAAARRPGGARTRTAVR